MAETIVVKVLFQLEGDGTTIRFSDRGSRIFLVRRSSPTMARSRKIRPLAGTAFNNQRRWPAPWSLYRYEPSMSQRH